MDDNVSTEASYDGFNEFFSLLKIDRAKKKSLGFIKASRVTSSRSCKRLERMSKSLVLNGGRGELRQTLKIRVPPLLLQLIAHIERSGLKDEGLYRKKHLNSSHSENSSILHTSPIPTSLINRAPSPHLPTSKRSDYTRMIELLKSNGVDSFDCRTASVLVRIVLKSLKLELISPDHQSTLVRFLEGWDRSAMSDIITAIRGHVPMGSCQTDTLGLVCTHLSHVLEQASFNKTDLGHLINSFGHVLGLRSRLLRFFISNAMFVFNEFLTVSLAEYDETIARSKQQKIVPLSIEEVRRLKSELTRKESLLSLLLDEVQNTEELAENAQTDKDELLWSVQREVTEIKRKLKRCSSAHDNLSGRQQQTNGQLTQTRTRLEMSVALGCELLKELKTIHSRMVYMKAARATSPEDRISESSAEDLRNVDNDPKALLDALKKAVQDSYCIKFRLAGVKSRVVTEQDRIRRLKIQRAQTAAMTNLDGDDEDDESATGSEIELSQS